MLIKTPEFDEVFRRNVMSRLAVNRSQPLREMGSYKIKKFGEPVTDIDLTAMVYYNPKLLQIISNIIQRAEQDRNLLFLRMDCGTRAEYAVPWKIGGEGGCDFDLTKAKKWFGWFSSQKLVPNDVLKQIYTKLYSKELRIKDLLDIENLLYPYGQILWSRSDIRRGYKDVDGVRYELLVIMKKETPVLEFAYRYGKDVVAIDVGLVDRKHRSFAKRMNSYYIQDWYKIMKVFRWKIEEQYRSGYLKLMAQVGFTMATIYQTELYEKLRKYDAGMANLLRKDMEHNLSKLKVTYDNRTVHRLKKRVNKFLSKYVDQYYKVLQPKFKKDFLIYSKRGIEAQIPVSTTDLEKRTQTGIRCPFFLTDIDDYRRIVSLALRTLIDVDELIRCVLYTADTNNVKVSDITTQLGRNQLALYKRDGNIVLTERRKEIKVFTKNELQQLQIYVLIFK